MPDAGSTGITERANEIEALVQRCREGDLCAFTALFERFQDRLYDLACAILQDGADPAQALSEAQRKAELYVLCLQARQGFHNDDLALACAREVDPDYPLMPQGVDPTTCASTSPCRPASIAWM